MRSRRGVDGAAFSAGTAATLSVGADTAAGRPDGPARSARAACDDGRVSTPEPQARTTSDPSADPYAGLPTEPTEAARTFLSQPGGGMGALNERMGVELLDIRPDRIVARMPVAGNTQPYGLLHGGASVVLAETLGSVGSAVHAHGLGRVAVGVDINATHHRAAREGHVVGVATPVHLGRSSACWEVVLLDERGKRVCTSRITCALVPAEAVGG